MEKSIWKNLGAVMEERFTEQAIRSRPRRLRTGFRRLDAILGGGISPGLTVLGGSPGLGKSTFVLQLAEHIAEGGVPVLYFSLEMSSERIAAKALSRRIFQAGEGEGITAGQLTSGDAARRFSPEQWRRIRQASGEAGGARNLYVVEEALSAVQIAGAARTFIDGAAQQNRPKPLMIVDYLQILPADGGKARNDKQAVDDSLKEMADLARSGVPVLLVSSLNRSSYHSPMQLEAFKETGGIEYSADVLLGLQFCACHQKGSWDVNAEKNKSPRSVEITVLKQRYGSSGGAVRFQYYAQFDCFVEEDPEAEQPAPAESEGAEPPALPAVPREPEPAPEAVPEPPEEPPAPRKRRKQEAFYMNNTKAANEIRAGSWSQGRPVDCRVFKDVVTRYELTGPLTAFDCNVADALYTLRKKGGETFSPGLVLRILSGDGKQTITEQKKREILASIEKLRTVQITIDCTEEMRAREKIGEGEVQVFSGPCLSAEEAGKRFRFIGSTPMPLYAYGEMNTQMIAFPKHLLEVRIEGKRLTNTTENINIKRFLIRRLEVLRGGGRRSSAGREKLRSISIQETGGLLTELGFAGRAYQSKGAREQRRREIYKTMVSILAFYQSIGYISDFTSGEDGIRVEGEVRDPWGLP